MKHGDISNQAAYTIGFRCEDCLIKFKENNILDKVLNRIVGKERRAEVDSNYRSVMEHIFRNTEYCVDLVVHKDNYNDALKELLDDLPFSRVVLISKETEITQRLLVGDLTFYVDDNADRRSLVNNKYAITLNMLHDFIGGKNV